MSHTIEEQQLGNYRLIRLLGRGGFAHVYLGEHIHLKTQAAVKVLDIEVIDSIEHEDFLTEARNIANLRHPNIVRVLDFDITDGTPFLVMDYAPNGSLATHHSKGSRLPLSTIVNYVNQVAAALQFAHDQMRLIHCDVKPANMLLGYNHEVLLSDFGIALIAPGSRAASIEHIMGTMAYMAPEHLNRRPDLASDQYALAVVVYEWLCGSLPFEGSPAEIYQQHIFALPPSLRQKVPMLPFAVEQVVQRALEKEPQQRFPRVQDFATALEDAARTPGLMQDAGRIILSNAPSPAQSLHVGTLIEQASPVKTPEPIFVGSPLEAVSPSDSTELAASPITGHHPQESGIVAHPLLRQQHMLILGFYSLVKEYEGRKGELQHKLYEDRRTTDEDNRRALKEVDNTIRELRWRIEEARSQVQRNGWNELIRAGTPTNVLSTIAGEKDPSRQLAASRSIIHNLGREIDTFLSHYPQPSNLHTFSATLAGLVAVVLSILLGLAFHSLVVAIIVALIVFVAGGVALFLSQLFPLRRSCATLEALASFVEKAHEQRSATLERLHNRRLSELESRHQQSTVQLERTFQEQLAELRFTFATFINTTGFSGISWDDPLWQQWKLQNTLSPVTRIGTLTLGAQFSLPPLPALVFSPGGYNLLLKATGASKAPAMLAVQAFALRLVATQPSGKVRFTLVDPTGLGQNVAAISRLADPDKILGTSQVWVDEQEIEYQLRDLTRHIRDTNQKLRDQYASLEEFNQAAGEHAEAYRILIVIDFPTNFTAKAARDLLTIAQNGPRCGISTIMVSDVRLGTKRFSPSLVGFDLQELEKTATIITWNGQRFAWQDPDFQECQFELDTLPQPGLVNHILQVVGRNPATSISVEQNVLFNDVLINLQWRAPREKIKLWLGHPVVRQEPTAFSFHRQSGGNLLILGKQEQSAIAMLMTAMMSMAAQCSPQMTRFYVLDLSVIDPGQLYIADTSPLEYVTDLLLPYRERIVNRRTLRDKLPGLITEISDAVEDRLDSGIGAASSIYFFICGLQEADDLQQNSPHSSHSPASTATIQRFLTVLRKGSKLGVHTLLWCDTFSNLKKTLGDQPLEHFDHRIVFHLPSKEDSIALTGEPAAVELSQERALFFSSEEGLLEKFRPYNLPSKDWLQWASAEIHQKGLMKTS